MEKAKEIDFNCEQYEADASICDKGLGEDRSQQLMIQKKEKYSHVRVAFIGY